MRGTRNSYAPASTRPLATAMGSSMSSDALSSLASSCSSTSRACQINANGFQIRMSLVALVVVLIVVGTASWLTYSEKLDGSSYGFLLGLIVGYVLTFVRDAIVAPRRD